MGCKHCGWDLEIYGSDIFKDVCTFCIDKENPETVYEILKLQGVYDQIEC